MAMREQLADVMFAVQELQRGRAEQEAFEAETRDALRRTAAQVEALQGAFGTLSDVLVEEVQELRAEADAANGRAAEGTAALRTEVRELRSEVQSLRAGTTAKLDALREAVAEIEAAVAARPATSLGGGAAGAHDSADVAELRFTVAKVEEAAARDREAARASSSATGEALRRLRTEVAELAAETAPLQQRLDSRVDALAAELEQQRAKGKKRVVDVYAKLEDFAKALDRQRGEDQRALARRVDEAGRIAQAGVEHARAAAGNSAKKLAQQNAAVEEQTRAVQSALRATQAQMRGMEAALAELRGDVRVEIASALARVCP